MRQLIFYVKCRVNSRRISSRRDPLHGWGGRVVKQGLAARSPAGSRGENRNRCNRATSSLPFSRPAATPRYSYVPPFINPTNHSGISEFPNCQRVVWSAGTAKTVNSTFPVAILSICRNRIRLLSNCEIAGELFKPSWQSSLFASSANEITKCETFLRFVRLGLRHMAGAYTYRYDFKLVVCWKIIPYNFARENCSKETRLSLQLAIILAKNWLYYTLWQLMTD